MPTVTVLLPVYNGEAYLEKSIQSVLSQSYQDLEILILNDGSTDGSLEIADKFSLIDKRIKIINFSNHIGLAGALNHGVRQARGLFLARIDSDDEWLDHDKIKKQAEFLANNPDYGLVGVKALLTSEKGEAAGKIEFSENDGDIRKKILIKNQFLHSGIMMEKEAAVKCGLYDEKEKYVEDYGLWLRLGQFYKFKNLPFFGLKYRLNPRGVTAVKNRKQVVNSFKLVIRFRRQYPNFFMACLKWILRCAQAFLASLFRMKD
ncbi:glycosyltransferase family 2 protein [Patescibacteria group bacterium]|nr:MAG: glycosyltransferase family 2 protein [Patescibacteria group bacterium]